MLRKRSFFATTGKVFLSLCFLTLIFSFFFIKKQHNHNNSGNFKTIGSLKELGIGPSYAATPQVKGTPNVAVTSYTNTNGTYTLWQDRHVTDSQTGVTVRTANQVYNGTTFPSGFNPTQSSLTYTTGRPKGSPRVAIDIVPHGTGTYILFGDGSIKNPGTPANGAVSSGGPWTRTNDNIYPTTISDNVLIGTTSSRLVGWGNTPLLQISMGSSGTPLLVEAPNDGNFSPLASFLSTGVGGSGVDAITIGDGTVPLPRLTNAAKLGYVEGKDYAFFSLVEEDPLSGYGIAIKRGGNVGIGTTSPGSRLQVGTPGMSGRMIYDDLTKRLYICDGQDGWRYTNTTNKFPLLNLSTKY